MPVSRTDKTRVGNKLGYQRTSIACEHCRRRKIRCLVAVEGDQPEQCENCIRLGRTCKFTPIDRRRGPDDKSQPYDKSGVVSIIPPHWPSAANDVDAAGRNCGWKGFVGPPVLRSNDPDHFGGLLPQATSTYFGHGPSPPRRDSHFYGEPSQPVWVPSESLPSHGYDPKTASISTTGPEQWPYSQPTTSGDYALFSTVPSQPLAQSQQFLFPSFSSVGSDRLEGSWQGYPSPVGTMSDPGTSQQLMPSFHSAPFVGPTAASQAATCVPAGSTMFGEKDMMALGQGHPAYAAPMERQRNLYYHYNDISRNSIPQEAYYLSTPRYLRQ